MRHYRQCLAMGLIATGWLWSVAAVGTCWGQAARPLAEGVLTVIAPNIDPRDAHSLPMPLPGVEAPDYSPNLYPKTATLRGQTQQVTFFRDVWQFEFAFLGLRQLELDVPRPDGTVARRNVWYMVYRVRNTGASLSHNAIADPKFGHVDHEVTEEATELNPVTLPDRFFGRFVLTGWVEDGQGNYEQVTYNDRILPSVVPAIRAEEDPARPLLDTVEMAKQILEPVPADSDLGGSWGVAVWENVDPRLDFISVCVHGLTNAYRIHTTPDGTHELRQKTLQLNFWRPGDVVDQERDRIVYGIPLVDNPQRQIEITVRYDLPGPVLQGFRVAPETLRRDLVWEIDGQVDPKNRQSPVVEALAGGQLPDVVRQAFTNAGITLDGEPVLETTVVGTEWKMTAQVAGVAETYVLRLEPQFWDIDPEGGIRFIKSLDHLWVYR
jgi:hypothetical protein